MPRSIVREAAFRAATEDEVKLGMLDRKLADATAFVMNIPARFYFERAMYAERETAELPPERLSELVIAAFSEAYGSGLAEYERMFWASKLHFYITEVPFYNFPYAFGFLFAQGLIARVLEEGPAFAPKYDDVLRLTGSHSCEDVARRALGVDLTQPDFWRSALNVIARDVEAFVALA